MRRKDREVKDPQVINSFIESCQCCRLGFNDKGRVYIVPLNFGFEETDGQRIFYFHSATSGRKIELTRDTGYAAFELDLGYEIMEADTACNYSAKFRSIIGEGRISLIENQDEKAHGLQVIMYHNTRKSDWEFSEKALEGTAVLKLIVTELSCKEKK